VPVVKQLGIGALVVRASSVAGQVLLAAYSAGWWSAQYARHRGWAVRRCFFLLDVSKLVIPFCSGARMVTAWKTGLFYTDLLLSRPVCHGLVGRVGRRG